MAPAPQGGRASPWGRFRERTATSRVPQPPLSTGGAGCTALEASADCEAEGPEPWRGRGPRPERTGHPLPQSQRAASSTSVAFGALLDPRAEASVSRDLVLFLAALRIRATTRPTRPHQHVVHDRRLQTSCCARIHMYRWQPPWSWPRSWRWRPTRGVPHGSPKPPCN